MRVASPLLLGALLLSLAACSAPGSPDVGTMTPGVTEAEGPMAKADRRLAERSVTNSTDGKAVITDVDLGNTEVGGFRAPVRGVLVTPATMADQTPLVVVNHLRGPNCAEGVSAYPCPDGSEGLRLDRGMTYLGESLAAQGYAVLIPDLSGVWVGADITAPYDQRAMWKDAVGTLVDAIGSDAAGTTDVYGLPDVNKIARNQVGLVVHSRAGMIVDTAIDLFGSDAVRGVLAYGPAYDTYDPESFSPAPADVPYLAITGEQDLDVGPSANLWLSEYLAKLRTTPALTTSVPGLGHMLINRALAESGIDERTACDLVACPDAAEHERVLTTVATYWFNATMKDKPGPIPLDAELALPGQIAGVDARWLAHTPGETVTHLQPSDFTADEGGTATVCRHADPMNPEPADDACPEPETGVIQSASELNVLTGASASTSVTGVKTVNVHAMPTGSYADQAGAGTLVSLTLTMAEGEPWTTNLDPMDPSLRDRKTDNDNGVYRVGTIRVPIPDHVASGTVTKVTVTSPSHPIELRGVDLVHS